MTYITVKTPYKTGKVKRSPYEVVEHRNIEKNFEETKWMNKKMDRGISLRNELNFIFIKFHKQISVMRIVFLIAWCRVIFNSIFI